VPRACLTGVCAFLSKTLGLAAENQIFNHRHRFFPPLMANGRTNAEDSGPEEAPESFFLGADPNSHRHLFSYGFRQLDGNQTTVPLFSNWRFAFYGGLLALVVFDVTTFCLRQRLIS
jgi:hypothetical protein